MRMLVVFPMIGMTFWSRLFRWHGAGTDGPIERRTDPVKRRAYKEKAELDAAVERLRAERDRHARFSTFRHPDRDDEHL